MFRCINCFHERMDKQSVAKYICIYGHGKGRADHDFYSPNLWFCRRRNEFSIVCVETTGNRHQIERTVGKLEKKPNFFSNRNWIMNG